MLEQYKKYRNYNLSEKVLRKKYKEMTHGLREFSVDQILYRLSSSRAEEPSLRNCDLMILAAYHETRMGERSSNLDKEFKDNSRIDKVINFIKTLPFHEQDFFADQLKINVGNIKSQELSRKIKQRLSDEKIILSSGPNHLNNVGWVNNHCQEVEQYIEASLRQLESEKENFDRVFQDKLKILRNIAYIRETAQTHSLESIEKLHSRIHSVIKAVFNETAHPNQYAKTCLFNEFVERSSDLAMGRFKGNYWIKEREFEQVVKLGHIVQRLFPKYEIPVIVTDNKTGFKKTETQRLSDYLSKFERNTRRSLEDEKRALQQIQKPRREKLQIKDPKRKAPASPVLSLPVYQPKRGEDDQKEKLLSQNDASNENLLFWKSLIDLCKIFIKNVISLINGESQNQVISRADKIKVQPDTKNMDHQGKVVKEEVKGKSSQKKIFDIRNTLLKFFKISRESQNQEEANLEKGYKPDTKSTNLNK